VSHLSVDLVMEQYVNGSVIKYCVH